MDDFISGVKALLKDFFKKCSSSQPINDPGDYYAVKHWVRKTKRLYVVFVALAVMFMPIMLAFDTPLGAFKYVIMPPMILLTGLGYATLILYLPRVVKDVIRSGSSGYKVGEQFETTHIEVTHEFGNTYKATARTENKGCLFAAIAGVARLMIWAFFCVYIGPFLTFKKVHNSIQAMNDYKAQTSIE